MLHPSHNNEFHCDCFAVISFRNCIAREVTLEREIRISLPISIAQILPRLLCIAIPAPGALRAAHARTRARERRDKVSAKPAALLGRKTIIGWCTSPLCMHSPSREGKLRYFWTAVVTWSSFAKVLGNASILCRKV